MKASDVMSSPVYVVSPGENIAHARNLMLKHHISRLPVMDNTRLVGILTRKDIAYGLRHTEPIWRRRPIDNIPVQVLMTPDPITVIPDTGINEIATLMINNSISGIPVVQNGSVTGMVTKSDLLKSSLVKNLALNAGDLMGDAITVSRYHSLDHIIDQMREQSDKIVVMNNDGSIAGIITESNLAFFEYLGPDAGIPQKDVTILRREMSAGRKRLRYVMDVSAIAEDVMTKPVITVTCDAPVSTLVTLMQKHHVTSLVVIEGGELKGIVKRDDIIREVAK